MDSSLNLTSCTLVRFCISVLLFICGCSHKICGERYFAGIW